jgi:RHS repeat-associated protein
LGSVKMVTNWAGEKVKHSSYEPFGEANDIIEQLSATSETKGFIGERFDADAGLQYLNARYYDPRLGMFIQPDWFDPTQQGVGTNRYSYSFNDPVNLSDPNGNFVPLAIAAVAALVASANYANTPGSDGVTYNRSSEEIGTSMVAAASGSALVSAAPKAVNGLFAAYPRTSMLANELALAEGTGMAAATAGAAGAALPKVIPKAAKTWNEFQSRTKGQFLSRADAAKGWNLHKQANGIKTGTVRSQAAKRFFLRQLGASGKAPKWMNQYLAKGRVPPGHHVDHLKPISVGGADTPFNMRLKDIATHDTRHKYYRPWE